MTSTVCISGAAIDWPAIFGIKHLIACTADVSIVVVGVHSVVTRGCIRCNLVGETLTRLVECSVGEKLVFCKTTQSL